MADLRLQYTVKGSTTVMSVRGTVDAPRCHTLRDGFELARGLRERGPIVVDLAGVDQLAAVALLVLRELADDTRRTGRSVTLRHLRREIVDDPRSLLLRHTVCADDEVPSSPAVEPTKQYAFVTVRHPAIIDGT